MDETPDQLERAVQSFASEFVKLKVAACYIRDYRNSYSKWITGIGVLRAVTSVGSIAGWLRLENLAWLWATLLLLTQLAEALQKHIPVTRKRQALSAWCRKLDALVVAAQDTWDDIEAGELNKAEIRKAVRSMRLKQLRAEAKAIPHGLRMRPKIFSSSQAEASEFFKSHYGTKLER